MEQLVIDNEIIAMNFKAMEGVPVCEETLAVDAIKQIGVGNDFLGHSTTMEHFMDASNPAVFDRAMLGEWRSGGALSTVERAHQIVLDVMENHQVKPIDADRLAAMEAVVEKADAAFKKRKMEE